jgi:hypothetical protein
MPHFSRSLREVAAGPSTGQMLVIIRQSAPAFQKRNVGHPAVSAHVSKNETWGTRRVMVCQFSKGISAVSAHVSKSETWGTRHTFAFVTRV